MGALDALIARLVLGDPDPERRLTCGDCGFDAVLVIPIFTLSETGIQQSGSLLHCGRCWAEKERLDGSR